MGFQNDGHYGLLALRNDGIVTCPVNGTDCKTDAAGIRSSHNSSSYSGQWVELPSI